MSCWAAIIFHAMLHLPGSVVAEPLTRALYAEIESGVKDSSVTVVTWIPDKEFIGYEGDNTLGPMPLLQSVGDSAFVSLYDRAAYIESTPEIATT